MLTFKDISLKTGWSVEKIRKIRFNPDFSKLFYRTYITKKNREYIVWAIEDDDFKLIESCLEEYPNNKSTGWSQSAKECYKAHLACNKCVNKYICSKIEPINVYGNACGYGLKPMKWTVLRLISQYGVPNFKD